MEEKEKEQEKKKKGLIGLLVGLIKTCIVIFVPGMIAALILFLITNAALVPTSKPEFCGTMCHEMDTVYASWQKSSHANNKYGIQVKCIDCHLPAKDKYFTHLSAKAQTGIKDGISHILNSDYDAEKIRKEVREHMTNDVCLRCHSHLKDNKTSELAELHDMAVFNPEDGEKPEKCIECHSDAGHAEE